MAMKASKREGKIGGHVLKRFVPYLLMLLVQASFTFHYFITTASFNHGMNPHVYVTYRNVIAALVLLPFAFFLERKQRPKMTVALFTEIFILSLLGVSLTLNMYFLGLKYTSPTFVAATINTSASIAFVIAVVLRLESLDLRSPRGIAKPLGTLVSLAGAMTMTLYKGPVMKSLSHTHIHIQGNASSHHDHWLIGSILVVASCITWALWCNMQAITQKKNPALLSSTTWMNFVGAIQSAFFTVIIQHREAAWRVGSNIDLWAISYGGVVMSGAVCFTQIWCTKMKGPVFVVVFQPISTIIVTLIAYFVLGEKLHLGSIVGAAVVIIGLYLLLWGKEGDEPFQSISEDQPDSNCMPDEP